MWGSLETGGALTGRDRCQITVCGRVRPSSDVSEMKLVFSIPPERAGAVVADSLLEGQGFELQVSLAGLAPEV